MSSPKNEIISTFLADLANKGNPDIFVHLINEEKIEKENGASLIKIG